MLDLTLHGLCLEYDFRALIVTGPDADEIAARSKWPIVAQDAIPLHLGVALFDRPFVFTPVSIITERQQTIEGAALFDWLVEGGYRMPRSEVFGTDAFGHKDAQVFARDIDVEESPIVVYGSGTWIVAYIEIDPALGTEIRQLDRPPQPDQPAWLERAEQPDRLYKALRGYRVGPHINWSKQLPQWIGAR